ncbi:MAG TPA: hypothetical protein VEB41_08810 [Burkholderiales bacterium]|nr:hypothetical protein [Burkholderiales bacterium]
MCRNPIEFETLLAYWLGELPAADEAPVEEHFFACAHCAQRLEALAALGDGIRAAVQAGRVGAIVSARFVERMKALGMRLREYRIERGGSVSCTIHADDDAVVTRIEAPLAGVKRLDAFERVVVGGATVQESRMEDVPFDPASGAIHVVPPPALLRRLPKSTVTIRLLAVDESGERAIGEYTLEHSPQ